MIIYGDKHDELYRRLESAAALVDRPVDEFIHAILRRAMETPEELEARLDRLAEDARRA